RPTLVNDVLKRVKVPAQKKSSFDSGVTPTPSIAGSENSRTEGEDTQDSPRPTGRANADSAVAVRGWLNEREQYREKRRRKKTTMNANDSTAVRVCGREGCGRQLKATNKSGFCTPHWYDSKKKGAAGTTSDHRSQASALRKPAAQVAV